MENRLSGFCELFQGETTVSKRELWLLAGACFFSGVTVGLLKAAWTHGVTIGSYNGNGNHAGEDKRRKETEPEGSPRGCKKGKAK